MELQRRFQNSQPILRLIFIECFLLQPQVKPTTYAKAEHSLQEQEVRSRQNVGVGKRDSLP